MRADGALGKRDRRESRATPRHRDSSCHIFRNLDSYSATFYLPRSGVPAPPFCVLRTEVAEGIAKESRGSPVCSIFIKAAGRVQVLEAAIGKDLKQRRWWRAIGGAPETGSTVPPRAKKRCERKPRPDGEARAEKISRQVNLGPQFGKS